MKFQMANSVLTIIFDSIGTMTLAAVLLLLGFWVKKKVAFLEKFCIPAPVVGGFIFVFLNYLFYVSGVIVFKFDSTYMAAFMLAFFTSVGLGTNLKILITGGKLLVVYWLVNVVITILQTGIGVYVSPMVGMHAVYGIVSGPVALVGGHGGAAAYGQTLESMGFPGASLVGLTAATFGLIVASLVGGPFGRRLVEAYDLKPTEEDTEEPILDLAGYEEVDTKEELSYADTMKNITAVLVAMTIGSFIVNVISSFIPPVGGKPFAIPAYVGAMFVAVILRNLNEKFKFYHFSREFNDNLGDVCLGIYLSMALVTLKLWELAGLAGPLLIVLTLQTVFLLLLTYFVVFRILGKNYDAAVMCSGLIGHDIGSTPTAVANMTTIMDKYGPSRKALIIVPIVGAFLIDVFYQPFVVYCINVFAR